jgi:hypothetical protein
MELAMNGPSRPVDDDRLLARLGAIADEIDPPPPLVYELGHEAFQLYRIDEELAELVADSRLDSNAVRASVADIRLLSFESAGMTIEVQISRDRTTRSVLGQLMRPDSEGGGQVYLETPGGTVGSAEIDADDRFEFFDAPESLVRFRIETAALATVTTAWVEL